jgi:hypothetical protein
MLMGQLTSKKAYIKKLLNIKTHQHVTWAVYKRKIVIMVLVQNTANRVTRSTE